MRNQLSAAIRSVNRNIVLCGSAATLAMLASGIQAQETVEEVVVQGVRAAQASAINTKRNAVSVVDGIAAEDIGKLPDVTISDSLQRIGGVQIQRVAGEGGSVQIRGLPRIATTLNGEEFLNATTITTSTADYGNLPSQLFSGADAYKSPVATLATAGISGTVDLKTRRPLDMDEGFSFAGSAEIDQGANTQEQDPTISGLVNWRNETLGILVSAVTTEKHLGTDFNGYNDTSPNGSIGWVGSNGGQGDKFYAIPHGFVAWNKVEERNRDGLNAAFQADLGEGFEFIADYFYSEQERFNRKVGLNVNSRWQSYSAFASATPDGMIDRGVDVNGDPLFSVSEYDIRPRRFQSFTQNNKNTEFSENMSFQLSFDNGGPLTGEVRYINASASNEHRHGYSEGDLLSIHPSSNSYVKIPTFVAKEHCAPGDLVVGDKGGCFAKYGKGITQPIELTYNIQGEHPVFSGFDQVVQGDQGAMSIKDYMAKKESYHIGAFSSEGNTDSTADMDIVSVKGNYAFEDMPFITSVDAGLRLSSREVVRAEFSYFSEFGANKCAAQWKAVDQTTGSDAQCKEGEMIPNPRAGEPGQPATIFQGYTMLPPTAIDEHNNAIWVTNFGPVKGVPGIWAADPRDYDDALAFHNRVFGNTQKVDTPGQSWAVGIDEKTTSLQANFAQGVVSGNLGLRIIDTELNIQQNLIGAGIEHSGSSLDVGDVLTKREYTDYLPSLNLTVDITDDLKLRAAAAKTMMALDLAQWGGSKSVGRSFNADCQCMRVVNGNLNGNTELNPWRAKNYETSLEWYQGDASMLNAGLFRIEIDSFTRSGIVMIDEPDADGIKRGPWPFTTQVQGDGGEIDGIELGAKLALSDFTDAGFVSNLGFDVNYTYADSSQPTKDIDGKANPFPQNSKNTYNIVGWYENDRLSARLAYNYRSDRLVSAGGAGIAGQNLYQDDYAQMDLSVSYDLTDNLSAYVNGSNILEEYEQNYLQYEDQVAFQNIYEARWAVGVRASF
ncbi:MAG TPA: TonB-dependent receptor [Cellvibrio sp.]